MEWKLIAIECEFCVRNFYFYGKLLEDRNHKKSMKIFIERNCTQLRLFKNIYQEVDIWKILFTKKWILKNLKKKTNLFFEHSPPAKKMLF
jgi:hypothetical protein